ncbi:MAG: hypothetical protein ABR971_12415 [Acidobacteriaceae bacterium]
MPMAPVRGLMLSGPTSVETWNEVVQTKLAPLDGKLMEMVGVVAVPSSVVTFIIVVALSRVCDSLADN